jgi:hypothetical protein
MSTQNAGVDDVSHICCAEHMGLQELNRGSLGSESHRLAQPPRTQRIIKYESQLGTPSGGLLSKTVTVCTCCIISPPIDKLVAAENP